MRTRRPCLKTRRSTSLAAKRDATPAIIRRLDYRAPYDFTWMLDFLRAHVLPGVERVDGQTYARTISFADGAPPAWLRVSAWPGRAKALRLELPPMPAAQADAAACRVRHMFDLDAQPRSIAETLRGDARLADLVASYPGTRRPCGWEGFEIAVRAVLGQQVSLAAACTFAARVARLFGEPLRCAHAPAGLTHVFPDAAALAQGDLAGVGVTRSRASTLHTVAAAMLDGRVGFQLDEALDDFIRRWVALPGIGPWTAHYIALRTGAYADAFPAGDLVLQRAVPNDGSRLSERALQQRAQAWQPWRGYATMLLWREAVGAAAARRGLIER